MKELTNEIIEDFEQPERAITNYLHDVARELAGVENTPDSLDSLESICDILDDCVYHLRNGSLSDK